MVIEFEQPGAGMVQGLGMPVKLSRTPGRVRRGGPALGEHTEEVLREAGLSDAEIADLLAAGAVAVAATAGSDEPGRTFLAR
jgi:formyl-CoA transferase